MKSKYRTVARMKRIVTEPLTIKIRDSAASFQTSIALEGYWLPLESKTKTNKEFCLCFLFFLFHGFPLVHFASQAQRAVIKRMSNESV